MFEGYLFGRHMGLLAEIYRPGAETLSRIEDKKEEVFAATIQAGRELVTSQQVSAETLNLIQQPIIDFQTFALMGNLFWKTCIAEGVTPKEFRDNNMIPRPDSIESTSPFLKIQNTPIPVLSAEMLIAVLSNI